MTASGGPNLNSPSHEKTRNVAIVGDSGAGKTTLAEALLPRAGVLGEDGAGRGRDDGVRHRARGGQATMSLSLAWHRSSGRPATARPTRHLLDTPGLRRLRRRRRRRAAVADLAVLVVSAVDGVELGTQVGLERCGAPASRDGVRQQGGQAPRRLPPRPRAAEGPLRRRVRCPRAAARRGGALHGIADVLTDQGFEHEPDGQPPHRADARRRRRRGAPPARRARRGDRVRRRRAARALPVGRCADRRRAGATLADEVLDQREFPVLVRLGHHRRRHRPAGRLHLRAGRRPPTGR